MWIGSSLGTHSTSLATFAWVIAVQSPSHVRPFATPWTAACQASLSLTISRSLPKFMSTALVMPSSHLILMLGLAGLFLEPRDCACILSTFKVMAGEQSHISEAFSLGSGRLGIPKGERSRPTGHGSGGLAVQAVPRRKFYEAGLEWGRGGAGGDGAGSGGGREGGTSPGNPHGLSSAGIPAPPGARDGSAQRARK